MTTKRRSLDERSYCPLASESIDQEQSRVDETMVSHVSAWRRRCHLTVLQLTNVCRDQSKKHCLKSILRDMRTKRASRETYLTSKKGDAALQIHLQSTAVRMRSTSHLSSSSPTSHHPHTLLLLSVEKVDGVSVNDERNRMHNLGDPCTGPMAEFNVKKNKM